MKGYGLLSYLREAYQGLRANGLVNLLAAGTIAMAILIVGIFLLVYLNLRGMVREMGGRLELSVYLADGATQQERDLVRARLSVERGVKKVVYRSRDEALALFRKELKGQEALLDGLGENPLPDSFEVGVEVGPDGAARIDALARRIEGYPGVDDVSYGREGAEAISIFAAAVTYGGVALAALLGVSVVFIISNSVRLALYSRTQEIELLQWIGATRGFIMGPFLLEGALIALLGSGLGIGVLAAVFYALPVEAAVFLSRPAGLEFLPPLATAGMVAGGGALGFAGALTSVTKFLE